MNVRYVRSSGPSRVRRRLLGSGFATAAWAASPALVRAQGKTLVTTGYGGLHEKWFRTAVVEPFEQKTGAKIQFKYGAAGQWLTSAIANRESPEIDVPMLSLPVAMRAITLEGIFLDLDTAKLPNAAEIDPMFFDLYRRRAIGFNYGDFGICYREDKVAEAPQAWADLWKPAHAGKLILPDLSAGAVLEIIVIAAKAHGGSETDLEPGWRALQRLKPAVMRFFKNNNEPIPMLTSGEAVICAWYSARIYPLKDTGVPVEFLSPKEGAAVGTISLHIAKNSRQRDLAVEFPNFAISRKPQEDFANGIEYGPTNRFARLTGRAAQRVPAHNQLMRIDWPVLAPQLPRMAQRWQRDIAG